MKRVLAVLGAVAMIGGAILVRGLLTDDGGGGSGGGAGGGDGDTHLVCATELEAACEALAAEDDSVTFEVEDAGETADRLTAPDFQPSESEVDGWLTLNPWPALVSLRADLANQRDPLGEPSDVLATTRLAVVGPVDRVAQLEAECGDADSISWRCLGEIADDSWSNHGGEANQGKIEVGHDDPTSSATGLLVLGQATGDYFGTTDFFSNDFDDGFRSWLDKFENADPGLNPAIEELPAVEQLEQVPAASWDAVGTLDPAATAAAARADDAFTVLYPAPMIVAEAVLAPIRGHEVELDDDALTAALETAGWSPGPAPQEAETSPSAGVFEALIAEWRNVT